MYLLVDNESNDNLALNTTFNLAFCDMLLFLFLLLLLLLLFLIYIMFVSYIV